MDEENKKINIDSFFNRVEEVSQVAGNALKQSNLNTSAIQANKTLINSLSITIEAMKTEIRDIANYIVIEKKLEKDIQKDKELEAQDARQKQAMTDRAQALSQPTQKNDSVSPQPEQGKGGGFLGGLLKAIAIGGLAALALPLLPILIPKLLVGMAVGIGAIALGVVGAEIVKLLPKIGKKIEEGYNASVKYAQETAAKLNAQFNNLKNSVSNFLSEKKEQVINLAKNVTAAGKEKIGKVTDLIVDVKDETITKGTKLLKSAKQTAENVGGFVKDKIDVTGKIINETKDTIVNKVTDTKDTVVNSVIDAKDDVVETVVQGKKNIFNMVKNISSSVRDKTLGAADFVTGGEFDLDNKGSSASDNFSPTSILTNGVKGIIDFVAPPPSPVDTSVLAPANRSNTSEVTIRPTSSSIPFIRTVKNQYLSTNPNTNKLPPEIARLIQ